MDASKLKNILVDLNSGTTDPINKLLSSLASNISSNVSKKIADNISEDKEAYSRSIINTYTPSNLKILEKIGATKYFGNAGYNEIVLILNKNLYDSRQTVEDLNEFIEERRIFIEILILTSENLKALNIEAHYSRDTFEVGILMPEEVTYNKIVNVTKELNQWDKVFKTVKELGGESTEDTEINFVNNGSLEFFIDNGPQIALCLALIIDKVVKIYSNITKIRIAREELKQLGGLPVAERKVSEKLEKDYFNKEVDKTAQEIIKQFASKQIEEGRLNELRVAVKGHVVYVAKCIGKGMIIEIIPPEILVPEEPEEDDIETAEEKEQRKILKQNYDKTLKQIEIVQKTMDTMKTIGKTGIDVVKYLMEGEEPEGDKPEDEEPKNEDKD